MELDRYDRLSEEVETVQQRCEGLLEAQQQEHQWELRTREQVPLRLSGSDESSLDPKYCKYFMNSAGESRDHRAVEASSQRSLDSQSPDGSVEEVGRAWIEKGSV